VPPEPRAPRVLLEQRVRLERASLVRPVPMARRAPRVLLDLTEPLEQQVPMDLTEPLEPRVLSGLRALLDRLATKDFKA